MRIGIMLRHFEQQEGGVKVYTKNLLSKLFMLDKTNQYVLIYPHRSMLGTYKDVPNVEEVAVRFPGKILWDQLAVPYIARKKNVDLIFNAKFTVPLLTRRKKIFVLHGSEWFVLPEAFPWYDQLYVKASFKQYCRSADAVITVAHAVKRDTVAKTGIEPSKFVPIHNGFDPNRFHLITDPVELDHVRERYKLPEKYILWVGQMDGRKNLGGVIRAFAQAKDAIPHHLVLAGELRAGLRGELDLIRELGIQDRVLLPGWIHHESLPAVYNMASLFLFPSLQEGFGIPLLEAMACGCPIVTANTCAPPEVVGDAGVCVDPLNIDAITAGMKEVLFDSEKRQAMIARGLDRVKDFGWEKCAREVLTLFEAVGTAAHGAKRTSDGPVSA